MSPSALAERGYAQGRQDGFSSGYSTGVRDGKTSGEAAIGSLLKGEPLKETDRSVSETNRGLNTLWRKLGGTLTALAVALTAFGGVDTAQLGDLRESSRVVTNITGFVDIEVFNDATRDLVTKTVTNGLASTDYVDARTKHVSELKRVIKPGSTTAVCNGLGLATSGHPVIEPRLDGVSEMEMQPGTNGVYACGTEAEVVPPMGSRNYDIVVREIPQFVGVTNGVEYALPPQDDFWISFADLSEPRQVETWCDPSIGYTNGLTVVLTNAPCVIKVREPSSSRLYCVVRPWSLADGL